MDFVNACNKVYPYVVGMFFAEKESWKEHEPVPKHSLGTGIMLGKSSYVLTANHVIPQQPWPALIQLSFIDPNVPVGRSYSIAARFPEHDLAILRVENYSCLYLNNVSSLRSRFELPPIGLPVGSLGLPLPERSVAQIGPSAYRAGITAQVRFKSYYISAMELEKSGSKRVVLDSFAYGGHSGGPVFDWEGRLFGIMSTSQGIIQQGQRMPVSFSVATLIANIQTEVLKHLK